MLKLQRGGSVLPFLDADGALDANEYFVPEHPEKDEPVDAEGERSKKQRFQGGAEEIKCGRSQVDAEAALNEVFKQVRDQVRRDGIHADDDQRKCDA